MYGHMLSESQTEKGKYHIISLIYEIKKQTETEKDWLLPEVGCDTWAKWVMVVKRYKRPHIK